MKKFAIVCVCCWLPASTSESIAQESQSASISYLIEHAISTERTGHAWTFHQADYQQDTRQLPIGVFDSGIGGLTVLEAILELDSHNNDTASPGPDGKPDFQDERFIYLGDQANMPYGNYAAVGKEDFLRELILKDVIFLLGRRFWPSPTSSVPVFSKLPVKAIAIGCNTATAYGLEDIQAALKAWGVPVFVIGVVESGARGVLEVQQSIEEKGPQQQAIAVLATVGTCNSGAYPKAIGRSLGLAGRRVPNIVQQGCVDLAAAIEGDRQIVENKSIDEIIRQDIREMVESYRQSGGTQPIGSIVLGCTHFPLVQDRIVAELQELKAAQVDGQQPYYEIIADQIKIVNPAELTAKDLFRSLARARLRAIPRTNHTAPNPKNLFFISVPNPRCAEILLGGDGGLAKDYKYGRETRRLDFEDTLVVPMTIEQLPPNSLNLVQSQLPSVWKCITDNAGNSKEQTPQD